ncbi:MAG: transcriptional repressor [Kofleriaceae bacterium]
MPPRPTSSRLDDELRASIRSRGLRATPARVAVLRLLALAAKPMSHAELFVQLPTEADRTTVFRALGALTSARLVLRVEVGDRVWRYTRARRESGIDAVTTTFVCTECGRVQELAGIALSSTEGPRAIRRGAVEVFIHGRCDDCA